MFASNVVHPGALLVAGIITDRLTTCSSQITNEAERLRQMRTVVFGVAITSGQVDTACLRRVVTRDQLIESRSYNELNNHVNQAVQYACVAPFSESLSLCIVVVEKLTGRFCYVDVAQRQLPAPKGPIRYDRSRTNL